MPFTEFLADLPIKSELLSRNVVQPLSNIGVGGLVFDILEEITIETKSEITDHFVEDNSSIQDHIARRPDRIKLTGFLGEILGSNNETPSRFESLVQKATTVNSALPAVTSSVTQIKDSVNNVNNNISPDSSAFSIAKTVGGEIPEVFSSSTDLYSSVSTLSPSSSKQARAYNYFVSLQNSKILVSVSSPYKFYTRMAIESIRITQEKETDLKSNITVTLKEYRVASSRRIPTEENRDGKVNQEKNKPNTAPVLTKTDNGISSSLTIGQ